MNILEEKSLRARLLDGADKQKTGKRCWLWRGYAKNGYGAMSVHDRMVYTHRLSFEIHKGPIPAGKEVCHTCDNPRCIRPSHLFAGTRLDNVRDAKAKGRAVNPPRCVGLKQHLATLSDEKCAEIRRRMDAGEGQRSIAADIGCSPSTAWRIGRRKTRVFS